MPLPDDRRGSLRIMHVMLGRPSPTSPNGIDQVIHHVARNQVALGHAVSILSISPKPPLPLTGVDTWTYAPATVPWLPSERMRELWVGRFPLNIPRRLMVELMDWRPDSCTCTPCSCPRTS